MQDLNKNLNSINQVLKQKGYRHSKLRDCILSFLFNVTTPATAADILAHLTGYLDSTPNKTTIYRELDTLKKENLIFEIDLLDGKKRYELNKHNSDSEHSHVVCTECGSVECLDLNDELSDGLVQSIDPIKETVFAQKGYKVTNQVLQFYGVCETCFSLGFSVGVSTGVS
ncbi:MAG: Fur family transcriptional regulator [Candidatus Caenarcaniphilales bacterium]|nr:Fur family transcriptional regulator [Candidatus Caenarcaniphilales bacterium]